MLHGQLSQRGRRRHSIAQLLQWNAQIRNEEGRCLNAAGLGLDNQRILNVRHVIHMAMRLENVGCFPKLRHASRIQRYKDQQHPANRQTMNEMLVQAVYGHLGTQETDELNGLIEHLTDSLCSYTG